MTSRSPLRGSQSFRKSVACGLGILLAALAAAAAQEPVAAPAQGPEQLLAEGHADEAIRILGEHTKAAPYDSHSWNLLCRAYLALEKWDRAVSACEKAVQASPDRAEYHLWLGRAYGEKAEHSIFITAIRLAKKTRMEFEKAVQLQENNVSAQSDLAEYFIEAPSFLGGGKDKAQAQAEHVAQLDPPTAQWIQARLAEKDKQYDQAEEHYRAAINQATVKAPYWLDLAGFYRRTERFSEMEQAIDRAVAAEKGHDDVFYEAAEILFKAGRNFPGAVNFLRRYLVSQNKAEEAPTFRAHYLLGEILEKMGDQQAAAAEYRAALALANDFEPARDALKRLGTP